MRVMINPLLGMLLSVVLVGCNDDDKKSTSSSVSSSSMAAASSMPAASSTPAVVSSAASSTPASSTAASSVPAETSSAASSAIIVVASSAPAVSSAMASSVSSVAASSVAASMASSMAASSSAPAAVVSGVAAVGAPIVNGVVTAKCANGSGFTQTVTTNSQGVYSGSLPATSFPCALQITSGTPAITLHSYVTSAGTINITPFTDLIIANASTMTPSTWFQSASWQLLDTQLQTATNNLKTSLTTSGYTLPAGTFNPLTVSFQIGDVWDQLLDELQAAIAASSTLSSYIDLLNLVKDGNFTVLPPKTSGGSTGGSGTGNASSCFNSASATAGNNIQLNYKSVDGESGAILNISAAISVNGNVMFNGKSTIESVSQTQATGAAPSTSTTKSYITIDSAAKTYSYHGSIVEVTAPTALTTTITINPAEVERFNLAAGESYSQTYTTTSSLTVFGFPVNTVTETSSTVTFKGIETITVPAGTYSTCRMETNDSGGISTTWFTVGTGMSIRTESGGDISELVSGSINGTAI